MMREKMRASKIILWIMCTVMLIAAAGCGQNSSPVGEWTVVSVRVSGQEMNPEKANMLGGDVMKISDDGTFQIMADDSAVDEGTWEQSDGRLMFGMSEGIIIYGHIDEGKLMMHDAQAYENAQNIITLERR